MIVDEQDPADVDAAAALLKSLDSRGYYSRFLAVGLYPDGRETHQFRPISIQLNVVRRAFASAMVRIGYATAICSIDVIVTTTIPQHRSDLITLHVDGVDIDRVQLELAEISLRQLIVAEAFIRFESLVADRLAFSLHVYVAVLNAGDGASLMDAVVGATSAALVDIRLPMLAVDPNPVTQVDLELIPLVGDVDLERVRVVDGCEKRIEPTDCPVCVTLVLMRPTDDDEETTSWLLCDPNAELVAMSSSARCQFIVGNEGRVYAMSIDCNGEQISIPISDLDRLVSVAIARQDTVRRAIQAASS